MRKLIAALFAASTLTLGLAGTAYAAAPGQPCTLAYNDDATLISTGTHDCIVRYSTIGDAIAAVKTAGDAGLYVWHVDGFIVNDGQGFVVRASDYTPDFAKPLEVVLAPA